MYSFGSSLATRHVFVLSQAAIKSGKIAVWFLSSITITGSPSIVAVIVIFSSFINFQCCRLRTRRSRQRLTQRLTLIAQKIMPPELDPSSDDVLTELRHPHRLHIESLLHKVRLMQIVLFPAFPSRRPYCQYRNISSQFSHIVYRYISYYPFGCVCGLGVVGKHRLDELCKDAYLVIVNSALAV